MTSRKLSESDKQEMLQLYRQPGETTSTLASRYGVSNSTISRILKTSFSEAEYETLIQQKRGGRASTEIPAVTALDTEPFASERPANTVSEAFEPEESASEDIVVAEDSTVFVPATARESIPFTPSTVASLAATALDATALDRTDAFAPTTSDDAPLSVSATPASDASLPTLTANGRRLRKRSSAPSEPTAAIAPPTIRAKILERVDSPAIERLDEAMSAAEPDQGALELIEHDRAISVSDGIGSKAFLEDEADLTGELDDDLDDDDLDDDDLDDDDLDDDLDGLESGALLIGSQIAGKMLVQVLPLAAASLPRTCYLVVDRSAELIARPLKEFGDLGQIPEAEILEKTLPVFDNHRIAKRYSNPRTQRVIKLPDAQVLQKTSSHLQAKGITRLLIDGQVYAL